METMTVEIRAMKTPFSAPLNHAVTVSSTAHLDAVFLKDGTVIKTEIVMMALMNLTLVCIMIQNA